MKLENIASFIKRGKSPKYGDSNVQIIKSGQARGYCNFDFTEKHYAAKGFLLDERQLKKNDLLINSSGVGTAGRVTLFDLIGDFVVDSHITIVRLKQNKVLSRYVLNILGKIGFKTIESLALGQSGQIELTIETISNIKIPLPPKNIQEKIVTEIEVLEKKEKLAADKVESVRDKINSLINAAKTGDTITLGAISENLDYKRKPVTKGHREKGEIPYYGASGIVDYVSSYLLDDYVLLVSEDGANLKARVTPIAFTAEGKIWVNNHAHILKFKNKTTHKLVELLCIFYNPNYFLK